MILLLGDLILLVTCASLYPVLTMSEPHHQPRDHMVFDDKVAEEYVKQVLVIGLSPATLISLQQIVLENAQQVLECAKPYIKPGCEILGEAQDTSLIAGL